MLVMNMHFGVKSTSIQNRAVPLTECETMDWLNLASTSSFIISHDNVCLTGYCEDLSVILY